MRGWPLIGRAEELRIITDASASPRSGGAAIVGPPGVGKTRLAHEAAAVAATLGSTLRWAVGTVAGQAVPMGAFAEWADDLDGNPLRLVGHVVDAITESVGDAPLMLVVDDAHLLDELSAFVLLQLVTRRATTVVTTIRSGEPCPDPITILWKEHHLRRLDLQPLSRPQSDELLRAVLGDRVSDDVCQRMWETTLGNVLYLRQLVTQERRSGHLNNQRGSWQWSGEIEMTPSLIELVELQIGAGAEPVHEVLDLTAVAEPLELSCLKAIVAPALIEAAERRGLITLTSRAATDVVHVSHPLYGEVRLGRAGHQRQRRLRGRIVAALAGNPAIDPVRLGLLWLDSDLQPNPVVLMRAAEQSVVRLDLVTAERLACAAADAGAGPEALILRAHLLILLNNGEQAERILDSFSPADVSEMLWGKIIHLRAVNLLWPLGRPDDARLLIKTAMAEQPSATLADHLDAVRAVQLAMDARPTEAIDRLDGVDLSRLCVFPALVALWALTIAHGDLGFASRAAQFAKQGYQLAANTPEVTYQGVGLAEFHVCALAFAGDLTESTAAAEHTYRQCRDAPGICRSVADAVRGIAALFAGDLTLAVDCLRAACTGFEVSGDTTGVFYRFTVAYTEALARSGDLDTAEQALTTIDARRHPSFAFVEPDAFLAGAWVAANRGRITKAQKLAQRGAQFARTHGQHAREVLCLQTAVQFGDNRPATAARLDELATRVEGPRVQLASRYAHALAGNDPEALWSVSCDLQCMGDHLAAADAAAHAHDAFARLGRRGPALTAATRVADIITSRRAISPATLAARTPLALTSREREIATLVADGLSNRQIAETLASAVRTVEGHIYRACRKLDVTTRHDLASVLKQHLPTHTVTPSAPS